MEFNVHSGPLKHYSSYFRNALRPAWAEGKSRILTLPEDSPTVFKTSFPWIYSRTLFQTPTVSADDLPAAIELCALFVFGDARSIPEFCNAVNDLFFTRFLDNGTLPTNCLGVGRARGMRWQVGAWLEREA